MIVVTGANGHFGRLVIDRLLARMPADELAVSVRDPAQSTRLSDQGVRVRRGDFDHPETLRDAFAGASTVLINATNYGTASETRARQQAAAIDTAQAAGAGRVVFTSWQDLDRCPLDFISDFTAAEKLVATSGAGWTILRMTFGMAASLARDVRSAQDTGTLTAPAGDARATPAAVTDLAEATANVLIEEGHDGRTYELTGPNSINWHDLASLASTLAGRDIHYRPTSEEECRAQWAAAGWPAQAIEMLIAYYAAFRSGWAGTPRPDLADLLHRPATSSLDAVRQARLP
ncbi:NAD(P)H-binding protein [Actinoallomurus purpureus]|uniref:NAD(P)H-binding protein n=1 Tax=Actinoallomurus purpureus TaxID=478114 RepID=UPI002093DFF5|nr:NAD(P)H-binding protein [Actinoallomurus purpureus]MCO6007582.1 NAD(P)H-binding protein [Actinoallomurus purpureus]